MAEEDLEKRLRILEQQLDTRSRKSFEKHSKRLLVFTAVAILVLCTATGLFIEKHKNTNPLNSIASKKNVPFKLYYPTVTPAGFSYLAGSAVNENGVIRYTFKNGAKQILVTEQASPGPNLNLDSIVGFSPLKTSNGTAYVGTNKSTPIAILNTKSTLMNITGTADVSADVVNSLIESLKEMH